MVKSIVFFFFILVYGCCQAQLVVKPPPMHPPDSLSLEIEERNHCCLHRNTFSLSQRMQFFPFNSSKVVKVISFRTPEVIVIGGKRLYKSGIPIKKDTICYADILESVILTPTQIDSLTDILYNTGYFGPVTRVSESDCYMPRNAIAFLDRQGKILGYIEICFECQQYRASSPKITIGEICDQKYELVRKFFVSAGIKYGTAPLE